MAPDSSTLAWRIPWREEPGVRGVTKSRTRLRTSLSLSLTLLFPGSVFASDIPFLSVFKTQKWEYGRKFSKLFFSF